MGVNRARAWAFVIGILAVTAAVLWRASAPDREANRGAHRRAVPVLPDEERIVPDTPSPAAEETEPAVPTEDRPAPASVLVRVVNRESREPIAGAHVNLESRTTCWSGTTDKAGTVLFEGVDPRLTHVAVRVYQAHLAGEWTNAVGLEAGKRSEVDVDMVRLGTVEGAVLSRLTGLPVAGAVVRLHYNGRSYESTEQAEPRTTDAVGAFSLEAGGPGETVVLRLEADGFVPAEVPVRLPGGTGEPAQARILLDPETLLRGIVRDPAGEPVAGAVVEARPADQPLGREFVDGNRRGPLFDFTNFEERRGLPIVEETTADDGTFRIQGLAAGGRYTLCARKDGFAPSPFVDLPLSPSGAETSTELRLRRGGSVQITWETEEPKEKVPEWADSPGAFVEVQGPEERTWFLYDAQSPSTLEDVVPGPVRIQVRFAHGGGIARAIVLPGETVEAAILMGPMAIIEGIVVDDAGRPARHGRVRAWPAPADGTSREPGLFLGGDPKSRDGEDGAFRIEGLEEGCSYILGYGMGNESEATIRVTAPARDVRFVVPRSAGIRGTVTLPPGTPAPERFTVLYTCPGTEGTIGASGGSDGPWNDGTFAFGNHQGWGNESIPPGRIRIDVAASDFASATRFIDVPPGETVDLGTIPLLPSPPLLGKVVDGKGVPIPAAAIHVVERCAGDGTAVADMNGRFRLRGLPPGPVRIGARAQGFLAAEATVDRGSAAEPAVVVLARGGLVRGSVRGSGDGPVAGAKVLLSREGDRGPAPATAKTDALGRFEIRLPPGEYQIKILSPGSAERLLAEGSATAVEDGETTIELRTGR